MSAPDFPGDPAVLYGVSALADDDAWAVGFAGFGAQGLILRWDGTQWTQVPAPSEPVRLQDVVALDATHAWAVGVGQSDFIAGWTGSSWQPFSVPGVPAWSVLNGVGATGTDDVWAVGADANEQNLPLIVHWDGTSWTRSPTQALGQPVALASVAAVAPDDAWAVGYRLTPDYLEKPLILHWDGSSWAVTRSPSAAGSTGLEDVSAVSAGDVIAVGTSAHGTRSRTLVEHWDGTRWQAVPSPNPSPKQFNALHGVSATPTDGVWAVGTMEKRLGNSVLPELILHWDGQQWVVSPGAQLDYSDDLMAIDVVGSHRLAVGAHTGEGGGDVNHILAEDSCG